MSTAQKIVTLQELEVIVAGLRKEDKKIVTTNGAFDLFHVGHKKMLEESKSLGDVLIVGINSDASVKQLKSDSRPIIPETQRAEIVAALACVDYVTIFNDLRPYKFLGIVKPNIHTKGGEYDLEKLHETKLVRQNGGVIIETKSVKPPTTEIIEKIKKI
jgi:rfaE bifunctional protein nucleotidyltransferase chain/domain